MRLFMWSAVILLLVVCGAASAESQDATEAEAHAHHSYDLARQGLLADAVKEIEAAIQLVPNNPLYHGALAGLFIKGGELNEARAELEKSLDLNPSAEARTVLSARLKQVDLELGAQLAKAGRYRDGAALASRAIARFPEEPKIFQMLGYFQSKQQLNRDAVDAYSHALQLDPSSSEASVGLGTALFSAGREDEARHTLEDGIVRFPRDATQYQALGVVLLRLSETGRAPKARAEAMFERALSIDAALPEAHYELGLISLDAGKISAAKDHLLVAERDAPGDSRVHFALARLYRIEGQKNETEREMNAFLVTKQSEPVNRAATP